MTPTADAGTATTTAPPVLLLATDGSADATLARTAAVQLAGRCGFDLHIVHAWQIPIVAGGFPGYAAPQEFFDGCADAARTILDEERGRAEADGARVAEAHLVEGRPASAVVELAER